MKKAIRMAGLFFKPRGNQSPKRHYRVVSGEQTRNLRAVVRKGARPTPVQALKSAREVGTVN